MKLKVWCGHHFFHTPSAAPPFPAGSLMPFAWIPCVWSWRKVGNGPLSWKESCGTEDIDFRNAPDYLGRGWLCVCQLCLSCERECQAAALTQRKGQKSSLMSLCGCESFPFFMRVTNLPALYRWQLRLFSHLLIALLLLFSGSCSYSYW